MLVWALLLTLAACHDDVKTAGQESEDPGFAGHWSSVQWGEHYIVVEGTTVRIFYTHDNGRILGTLDGTTVTGWWTETPSRTPNQDAGDVTFTLTRTNGKPTIDGVWSYGPDGPKRENWDLTYVDGEVPAQLASAVADPDGFVEHP